MLVAGTTIQAPAGGFVYNGPDDLQLRGSEAGVTTIVGPAGPAPALNVTASGLTSSEVRDLTVRAGAVAGTTAVRLERARGVELDVRRASSPVGMATGVLLDLGGALRDSSVIIGGNVSAQGVLAVEGSSNVRNTFISSPTGVNATTDATALEVERVTISASEIGFSTTGAGNSGSVRDSRIVMTQNGGGVGIQADDDATTNATNVTVAPGVTSPSPLFGVRAIDSGPGTATLNLDSSTVRGFADDVLSLEQNGGNAVVNTSYSNYQDVGNGGGEVNQGPGRIDGNPKFIRAFNGILGPADFHLDYPSALIDTGNPAAPPPSAQDRDGLARVVDGNGVGGPRRDMGAYEYQRRPPVVAFKGPSSGKPGQQLTYSANDSDDPDPGDSLSFAWTFGDGSSASSGLVSHAYAKAGVFR